MHQILRPTKNFQFSDFGKALIEVAEALDPETTVQGKPTKQKNKQPERGSKTKLVWFRYFIGLLLNTVPNS